MTVRLVAAAFLFLLPVPGITTLAQAQDDTLPPKAQEATNLGVSAAGKQEWEQAIKHFNEARKAAPYSPSTLFNLAMAYDKAGKYDLVADTWYRAYLAAASTAQDTQTQNRSRLVRERIAALEKKVEETMGKIIQRGQEMVATGLEGESYKDSAYWSIAQAQAEAGDITGAKATVARIAEKASQAGAYAIIANAQIKAGDKRGALETIATVKEIAFGASWAYVTDRFSTYMDIAFVQARAGDIAGAKTTAARTDYFYKPLAYRYIAEEQTRAGDRSGALKTIALAKESAVGLLREKDEPRVYALVAIAQARAGDKSGALKTIENAKKAVAKLGKDEENERLWAYAALVEAESLAGDKDEALRIKKIIQSYVDKLEDRERSSAYATIADAQAEAGNKSAALKTIALAKEAADEIDSDYFRDFAYRIIANAQATVSNMPEPEESDAARVPTGSGGGVPAGVVAEIDSWAGLFAADRSRPVSPDFGALIASLKKKEPSAAVEHLTTLVSNMARPLQDIRINKAKWKRLRTQTNR